MAPPRNSTGHARTIERASADAPPAANRAQSPFVIAEWLLAHLTQGTRTDRRDLAVLVAVLTLAIGAADYASGIRISLAVFYLVPVLLTTAWFGRHAGVLVAVLAIVLRVTGDVVSNDGVPLPLWSVWNSVSALLMFLFVVWVFSSLLALNRRVEQRVAERTAALSAAAEHRIQLEHELLEISSRERNDMGQELHDDICQHLVGTALAVKVLSQRLSQHERSFHAETEAILGMVEQGIGKTRRLARGLLLSSIQPDELPERLNDLAEEGSRSGIPCHFQLVGAVRFDDPTVAAQIYRIAQEAMRNAIRHSAARRIDLSLAADERAVCLMIEDDGAGLIESRTTGMGLQIMSSRAAFIGATLSLVPTPGKGTRVICHLPLAPVFG